MRGDLWWRGGTESYGSLCSGVGGKCEKVRGMIAAVKKREYNKT